MSCIFDKNRLEKGGPVIDIGEELAVVGSFPFWIA